MLVKKFSIYHKNVDIIFNFIYVLQKQYFPNKKNLLGLLPKYREVLNNINKKKNVIKKIKTVFIFWFFNYLNATLDT